MKLYLRSALIFFFIPRLLSQNPQHVLIEAYNTNSEKLLINFLEEWSATQKPYTDEYISNLSDTLQIVYDLFKQVYYPYELSRYCAGSDDTYKDAKYIVVQNTIAFVIVDTLVYSPPPYPKDKYKMIIKDFYPNIDLQNSKVLFYIDKYVNILKNFLLEGKSISSNIEFSFESYRKKIFLHPHIIILQGHLPTRVHILTYPKINMIRFNSSFKKASINYQMPYSFCRALYEKMDGNWVLIYDIITGME